MKKGTPITQSPLSTINGKGTHKRWIKQIKTFFADFLIVFYFTSQFSLLVYLFAKLLQHGN